MQKQAESSGSASRPVPNPARTRLMALTALFSALTAAGALLKIPFYPAPMTLQTLFTLLAAVILPAPWAALSQVLYLTVGLVGLPVFANGGGPAYVLQPTFGYLLLLPLLSWVIGEFSARNINGLRFFFILLAAQCLHLLGGSVWLFVNLKATAAKSISLSQSLMLGAVIFLPSAVLKAAVAAWLSGKLRGMVRSSDLGLGGN